MGIFNKIKRLLAAPPEPQPEEPKISDDQWLIETKEELTKKLKKETIDLLSQIGKTLDKLQEDTASLENFDVDQKRQADQIKEIVKQARQNYITHINRLIADLRSITPEDYKPGQMKKIIEQFQKSTVRIDFNTTQLIGDEVDNIRKDILDLKKSEETFLKKTKSLQNQRDLITTLSSELDQVAHEKNMFMELRNKQAEIEKKIERVEKDIKSVQASRTELENSPDALEKNNLSEEAMEKTKEFEALDAIIKNAIERKALSKFAHAQMPKEKRKYVEGYIDRPAETLSSDTELQIISIFDDIKSRIEKGLIEVKDIEKTREKLNVTENQWRSWKDQAQILKSEIATLQARADNINIDTDSLTKKETMLKSKLLELQKEREALKKKSSKYDETIAHTESSLESEIQNLRNPQL